MSASYATRRTAGDLLRTIAALGGQSVTMQIETLLGREKLVVNVGGVSMKLTPAQAESLLGLLRETLREQMTRRAA